MKLLMLIFAVPIVLLVTIVVPSSSVKVEFAELYLRDVFGTNRRRYFRLDTAERKLSVRPDLLASAIAKLVERGTLEVLVNPRNQHQIYRFANA